MCSDWGFGLHNGGPNFRMFVENHFIMMYKNRFLLIAVISGAVFAPANAWSSVITDGFTFSVASSSNPLTGNHFHSSTGGVFGNPAGKAEVGAYFGEQVRGLSEYNISGLSPAGPAFVTFQVFNKNGLFGIQEKGNMSIDINSYRGN